MFGSWAPGLAEGCKNTRVTWGPKELKVGVWEEMGCRGTMSSWETENVSFHSGEEENVFHFSLTSHKA